MMQVRINPTSIETMRFLQNNIDQYPNRVQAAKGRAVVSAKLKIEQYMKSQYGKVGNAMVVEERVGPKTATVNIRPKRAGRANSRTGYSAAWGANVKFYGRKAFTSKQSQTYKLRKGSSPPYPRYIKKFKVKATPKDMSFRSNIRRESRRILEREMMKSLRSYGFGPRGGAPRGMADI